MVSMVRERDKRQSVLLTTVWISILVISVVFLREKSLVFSFSNRVEASGSVFLAGPQLYFSGEKAVTAFSVVNRSQDDLDLSGEVSMRGGLGQFLWKKDFDIDPLPAEEARDLEFSWLPQINLLGRATLNIKLFSPKEKILETETAFVVLPGPFGGVAIVSLVFVSTRGLGRLLRLA
jgi:hypothetical protein